MLWLKVALALCVIAFGTFLGYAAAGKYRSRAQFYVQLHDFNERYLSELGYARKPLGELLRSFDARGDFKKMLDAFAAERRTEVKFSYLTAEERENCGNYLSQLGRGDARSQRDAFGARRAELGEKKKVCAGQAKEKGALYTKLGLMAGLAFVILIV